MPVINLNSLSKTGFVCWQRTILEAPLKPANESPNLCCVSGHHLATTQNHFISNLLLECCNYKADSFAKTHNLNWEMEISEEHFTCLCDTGLCHQAVEQPKLYLTELCFNIRTCTISLASVFNFLFLNILLEPLSWSIMENDCLRGKKLGKKLFISLEKILFN